LDSENLFISDPFYIFGPYFFPAWNLNRRREERRKTREMAPTFFWLRVDYYLRGVGTRNDYCTVYATSPNRTCPPQRPKAVEEKPTTASCPAIAG
jgi:hypothetical protein